MRGKLACCKYSQTTKKGKHRKTKQHSSGNTLIHVVVNQQKKNPTAAFREALRVIGKKHSTSSTSAHIAGDKLSIMELFTSFRSSEDIFSFFCWEGEIHRNERLMSLLARLSPSFSRNRWSTLTSLKAEPRAGRFAGTEPVC